jgi:hypothetical protein
MKKFLLSFLAVAFAGQAWVSAQCNLFPNNLTLNLTSATAVGSSCQLKADIAFDIQHNAGNKKIWVNLWNSSDYGFIVSTYLAGNMPTLDQLNGADNTHAPVAVIGINTNTTPVTYFTTYSADAAITPSTGTTITMSAGPVINGSATDHFVLTDVSFTAPGGCSGLILQGDIWATNSNSGTPAIQCSASGISFFGDPTISGQMTCVLPKQFQVILHTVSLNPIDVNYKVYIDNGPVGKDPTDVLVYTSSSPISISSSASYTQPLTTWSGDQSRNLLVELNVLSPFTKTIYDFLTNSCTTLPVSFQSFTASRDRSIVTLNWVTASEQNSRGFEVQRQVGAASWQTIAFVSTQAAGGNSNRPLNYSYVDVNQAKGISNYRIHQVDLDGHSKYTQIVSVKAEGQKLKTIIYPNPSSDGKVTVVFDDANSSRDVQLMDLSGRIVRQWKSVSANNLVIDQLRAGFYQLKIVTHETGEESVEKIIVNK